jgi:hypothetical protein
MIVEASLEKQEPSRMIVEVSPEKQVEIGSFICLVLLLNHSGTIVEASPD